MQTIRLEIEDSKLEIFLNIIQNLKDDVISKYELLDEDDENKNFMNLSIATIGKDFIITKLGELTDTDKSKLQTLVYNIFA